MPNVPWSSLSFGHLGFGLPWCCGMWHSQQYNIHPGGHTLRELYFQLNECTLSPHTCITMWWGGNRRETGSRCQERMVLCFGANDKEKPELALKSVAMTEDCLNGRHYIYDVLDNLLFEMLSNKNLWREKSHILSVWFSIIYILYICLLTYFDSKPSLHMYLIKQLHNEGTDSQTDSNICIKPSSGKWLTKRSHIISIIVYLVAVVLTLLCKTQFWYNK